MCLPRHEGRSYGLAVVLAQPRVPGRTTVCQKAKGSQLLEWRGMTIGSFIVGIALQIRTSCARVESYPVSIPVREVDPWHGCEWSMCLIRLLRAPLM